MGNTPSSTPLPKPTPAPSSSTPTWYQNCTSTPGSGQIQCTLPLIGPTGSITNQTPQLNQQPPINNSDACCNYNYNQVEPKLINNLKCGAGQIKVNPKCNENLQNCNRTGCCGTCQCAALCYTINETGSCPLGKYNSYYLQSPNINTVCNYVATSTNLPWTGSTLPQTFITPMTLRRAITQYLTAWSQTLYDDPSGFNIFHQSNYLFPQSNYDFIKQSVLAISGAQQYASYLPGNTFPPNFINNVMIPAASYPQFIYDSPSSFSVILYAYNTDVANTITKSQDTSNLIQSLTLENGMPILSAPSNKFDTGYLPADLLNNPYYIIADLVNMKIFNASPTNLSQLQTVSQLKIQYPNGDFYIVGRIYVTTVIKWSPILFYLFVKTTNNNLPYDNIGNNGFCDKIINDANLVPVQCYQNTCSNTINEICKQIIQTNCIQSNLFNFKYRGIVPDVQRYFLNANSYSCDCYNTRLAPPLTNPPTPAAMCFTRQCTTNQPIMDAFGLTDDVCKGYCNSVYGWLTATNADDRSRQPEVLDPAKYQRLCGDYNPSTSTYSYFNNKALGIAVIVSILIWIIVFFLIRKTHTAVKIIILLIFAIILIAGTVFLARDLNGLPECANKQQICYTRFTHKSIPNNWCSYQKGCECQNYGYPCDDGNSVCLSGKCFLLPQPSPAPSTRSN